MPTNLPPEYFKAEELYKAASTTEEKINRLEELISTIPKHKGTDKLRADLRRRLSRLKDTAKADKKKSGHTSLFHVEREGAARVIFAGPPNTGKSSLLAALTNAEPKVSGSPYTTWSPHPGMMEFGHVQIQLIDTPPMSREHTEAELLDLMRSADLVLVVVDLKKDPLQQLNETVDILMEHAIMPQCKSSQSNEKSHAVKLPFIVAVNKTDSEELLEDFTIVCDLIEGNWPIISISATTGMNLDQLKEIIFRELQIIRVYSKPPGEEVNYTAPFVLTRGSTVLEFAEKVHKDFLENLKMARVWGAEVYDGQQVSRDHELHDGDIVELHT